jgi:hypothetical protein
MNVLVLRDFTLKSKDDIKFEWVIAEAAKNPRSGGKESIRGQAPWLPQLYCLTEPVERR